MISLQEYSRMNTSEQAILDEIFNLIWEFERISNRSNYSLGLNLESYVHDHPLYPVPALGYLLSFYKSHKTKEQLVDEIRKLSEKYLVCLKKRLLAAEQAPPMRPARRQEHR